MKTTTETYKGFTLTTHYDAIIVNTVKTEQMTTIAELDGEAKFGTFADIRFENSIEKMKLKIDNSMACIDYFIAKRVSIEFFVNFKRELVKLKLGRSGKLNLLIHNLDSRLVDGSTIDLNFNCCKTVNDIWFSMYAEY